MSIRLFVGGCFVYGCLVLHCVGEGVLFLGPCTIDVVCYVSWQWHVVGVG